MLLSLFELGNGLSRNRLDLGQIIHRLGMMRFKFYLYGRIIIVQNKHMNTRNKESKENGGCERHDSIETDQTAANRNPPQKQNKNRSWLRTIMS